MAEHPRFDVLVVGGGINGAGLARDAAGRGLSVLLVEKDDLGQATSSRSSKLIHGGLRYLEHGEFRLVREALIEREVLLRAAPHIIWPLRFVLPHSPEQRPAWLVRLGLFLYDHLGGRERLPGTRSLDLRRDPEGAPIRPAFRRGFVYSDCWADDARLVVLNAQDAARRGAAIRPRTELVGAARHGEVWRAEILDRRSGARETVEARVLLNAAGPWVERLLGLSGATAGRRVRLVKGSHIVVRRFVDGPEAFLLQNGDGRVIFVIPYERDFALIGTTDVPYGEDAGAVAISPEETAYLLDAVNRYFKRQLVPGDIVHSYAGVRPLYDDASEKSAQAVTREYVFELDPEKPGREAPILSVFGGKITTFRRLAEHALEKLSPFLPEAGPAWTRDAPLPGGDMPDADFELFRADLAGRWPALPEDLRLHYGRLYGTAAFRLLDGVATVADLGRRWGPLLYGREVEHLVAHEWAAEPDDVLWRRTKHGLHMTPEEREVFAAEWGR